MGERDRPYHHGDLRRALIESALEIVTEQGPMTLSLREVARRVGVSHAAPAHHFGDKTGLITAVAAHSWSLLADALAATAARTGDFAALGVTYVVFATKHPGHFAVMRNPQLVHADDLELIAARDRAGALLRASAAPHGAPRHRAEVLSPWALVHGLAALLQEGNIAPDPGEDVAALARAVTRRLQPP